MRRRHLRAICRPTGGVRGHKRLQHQVGAENCHWEKSGAYTGEISTEMLTEMGVEYVVIGHSERRTYFGETDATVQKRVRAALDAGLTVILCVGETLEQREQGITFEIVGMQTKSPSVAYPKRSLPRNHRL